MIGLARMLRLIGRAPRGFRVKRAIHDGGDEVVEVVTVRVMFARGGLCLNAKAIAEKELRGEPLR